jgi:LysM repeat protein
MYLLDDALTIAAQTINAKNSAESTAATKTPLATSVQTIHTTVLPGSIAGEHHVAMGETLSCIGRGYGVLPKAIADTNGIDLLAELEVGQVLLIPEVQWSNISTGPVCPPQFPPPFLVVTATMEPSSNVQSTRVPRDDDERSEDSSRDSDDSEPQSNDPEEPPPPDEPDEQPTDDPPKDDPPIVILPDPLDPLKPQLPPIIETEDPYPTGVP